MNTTLKTVTHDTPVLEAVIKMRDEHIGALFVEKDSAYIGIVTERDVLWKATAAHMDLTKTPVHEIMSTPILTVDAHESTTVALDLMLDRDNRHLGVTENGKVVGMTSSRDILTYLRRFGESHPQGASWHTLLG